MQRSRWAWRFSTRTMLGSRTGETAMRTPIVLAAATFLSGLATMAYAVTGQFDNMCAEGLALHKQIQTNCSIHNVYEGKTYCFGSVKAEDAFMKNPAANLAKAKAFY